MLPRIIGKKSEVMRLTRSAFLLIAGFALSGCAAVWGFTLWYDLTAEKRNDASIGYRSAPNGTTAVRISERFLLGDALPLGANRAVLLMPYNALGRSGEPIAASVFGIGVKLVAPSAEPKIAFSLDPNKWTLILSDGSRHKPVGHRFGPGSIASPTRCMIFPDERPQVMPELDNPLSQAPVEIGPATYCVEVYFAIVPPAPEAEFHLLIDSIKEGSMDYGPLDIAFERHYGG